MRDVRGHQAEKLGAMRPRVVLSGPPGVGKSALGERLAERLGVPFFDLDTLVATVGRARSAGALLEAVGETEFRRMEAVALTHQPTGPGVLALGGGTLTTKDGRAAARRHGILVGLDASVATLERRADPSDRPLLRRVDLGALLAQRADTGGFVDVTISTEGSIERAVDDLEREVRDRSFIDVQVDSVVSRVLVGHKGMDAAVVASVRNHEPKRPVLVVFDRGIPSERRAALRSALEATHRTHVIELDGGEAVKSFGVLEEVLEAATSAGCGRQSVVVGVGGGAVLDLTAMAASLMGRGAPLVLVPTTLVAQIDASIGGKTAIDLRSGKNLAGTFHPADDIIVDTSMLSSLDPTAIRAGLAELVKIAVVAEPSMFEALESGRLAPLAQWIAPAISAKARVVAADPYDRHERRTLNFGHTFGHAFESATGCSHGEAVAIGMAAEVRLGRDRGWTPASDVNRILGTLERLGLPVCSPLSENCISFLRADKKAEHETLELAVVEAIGQVSMRREAFQDLAPALVRSGDCR